MKDYTKEHYPYGVQEPEKSNNIFFLFFLVFLSLIITMWVFQIDIGDYMYEKYGIESSFMSKSKIIKPTPLVDLVEEKNENENDNIRIVHGGVWYGYAKPIINKVEMDVETRLKDGNVIWVKYDIYPKINLNDQIRTRNIICEYFSNFTIMEVHTHIWEHHISLINLILTNKKIKRLHIHSIMFNRKTRERIERAEQAKMELESAKQRVALAKQEAELIDITHQTKMDKLKAERTERLFQAETQRMENRILGKKVDKDKGK